MVIAIPTSSFKKKTDKLPKKIRHALADRLRLFVQEPFHPLLDNHKLTGDRKHQRSINITGDWRLIFEEYDEKTVWLIDVDTHSNLYGK